MSFEERLAKYDGLIKHAAGKFHQKNPTLHGRIDVEELVQEGLLALWRVSKKHPFKEEREFVKIFRTSLSNAFRDIRSFFWRESSRISSYCIDLDPFDIPCEGAGFSNLYFQAGVQELKALLTDLAAETVELLCLPSEELIEIVREDYCQKEERFRVGRYKILKKHLAQLFGITEPDMRSIFKEIKLTLELNRIFA